MKKQVNLIYHPSFSHDYPTAGCECPSRVTAIIKELQDEFLVITPEPCTESDILLCHTKRLHDEEKAYNPDRYETARLALGGAMLAANKAMQNIFSFAIIRPPGHHASSDSNWGFCFFNNMAIALRSLQREKKIKTAAVLDIDLHFGDGTDNIFADDDTIHVLNIQSSNAADFINETRSALQALPEIDILAISAGFDQYIKDWGANLSTKDYYTIGSLAADYANKNCDVRIFAILEGGYFIPDLGKNTLSLIKGITD